MNAELRRTHNLEFWTRWQGQLIHGAFPLRRLLGCSSYSAVFLTEHKSKGLADAAIKFVRADAALAKAQLPQWEAAATLSHPHLVGLFDVGRYAVAGKEFVFVVMEYGEQTLAEILRARALNVEELWELLIPTLDAMTFLHRRHLVHGHLQPANVLAVNDRLKLSSDTIRPLGHRSVVAASVYDAPEMKTQGASTAGDVWSLGATLVEALTRRVPASSSELALPAGVPASLAATMQRCLSLAPGDRPLVIELRSEYKIVPAPDLASVPAPMSSAPPAPAPAQAPQTSQPVQVSPPQTLQPPQVAQAMQIQASSPNLPPTRRFPKRGVVLAIVGVGLLVAAWFGWRSPSSEPELPEALFALAPKQAERKQDSVSTPAPVAPSAATPASQPAHTTAPAAQPANSTAKPNASSVLYEALPSVPEKIRNGIQGRIYVTVRVLVSPEGNVTGALLESPGPSKYFARLADNAAREWQFAPEDRDGNRVWLLTFQFTRDGESVRASEQ